MDHKISIVGDSATISLLPSGSDIRILADIKTRKDSRNLVDVGRYVVNATKTDDSLLTIHSATRYINHAVPRSRPPSLCGFRSFCFWNHRTRKISFSEKEVDGHCITRSSHRHKRCSEGKDGKRCIVYPLPRREAMKQEWYTLGAAILGGGGIAGIINAVLSRRASIAEARKVEISGELQIVDAAKDLVALLRTEINTLASRVDALETDKTSLREEVRLLHMENRELKEENKKLNLRVDELHTENEDLKARLTSME